MYQSDAIFTIGSTVTCFDTHSPLTHIITETNLLGCLHGWGTHIISKTQVTTLPWTINVEPTVKRRLIVTSKRPVTRRPGNATKRPGTCGSHGYRQRRSDYQIRRSDYDDLMPTPPIHYAMYWGLRAIDVMTHAVALSHHRQLCSCYLSQSHSSINIYPVRRDPITTSLLSPTTCL